MLPILPPVGKAYATTQCFLIITTISSSCFPLCHGHAAHDTHSSSHTRLFTMRRHKSGRNFFTIRHIMKMTPWPRRQCITASASPTTYLRAAQYLRAESSTMIRFEQARKRPMTRRRLRDARAHRQPRPISAKAHTHAGEMPKTRYDFSCDYSPREKFFSAR